MTNPSLGLSRTMLALVFGAVLLPAAGAADVSPILVAEHFARALLRAEDPDVLRGETYYGLEGAPCAHVYVCGVPGREKDVLTLAVGSDRNNFPLLFFYFDRPVDEAMRATLGSGGAGEVVVCQRGLYLHVGETYYEWPTRAALTAAEFQGRLARNASGGSAAPEGGTPDRQQRSERLTAAWASVDRGISGVSKNMEEVIIPGVPNYLWYINCALTTETMILGFWDDRGFDTLIPGGSSADGFFSAPAEELCWIEFAERLPYYTGARELGNGVAFKASTGFEKQWETYKDVIDTKGIPVVAIWSGPPYGAHSTVGVGYKEQEAQRFLILHDTWVSRPAYVNYDQYYDSFVGFYAYEPASPGGRRLAPAAAKNRRRGESPFLLHPVGLTFVPPLEPARYSYHCMEPVDITGDGRLDYVVCNFSYVGSNALKVFIDDGSRRYVLDSSFTPVLASYECLHVAKAEDFDRDGDLDVAVTGYWSSVRVFVNQGGSLSSDPVILDGEGRGFTDLAWGDYDGDGDSDVAASTLTGTVRVYRNDGTAFARIGVLGAGLQYQQVQFCDLDGDAYPELLACDRNGSVVAFKNDHGSFSGAAAFGPAQGHGALSFEAADIDRDGFCEIVTVDDGTLVIFDNVEGTVSPRPMYLDTDIKCFAKDILLRDLDRDGFPELLVASYNGPQVIFSNRAGRFLPEPAWISARAVPSVRVHAWEASETGGMHVAFLNVRGGAVEIYEIEPVEETPFRRGDANGDGRVDVSDACKVLLHLFAAGAGSSCERSVDANDSGVLDIADAVRILAYLFADGEPLSPPFPDCAIDQTDDPLGCESYPACP
jgi:hypothetical protein